MPRPRTLIFPGIALAVLATAGSAIAANAGEETGSVAVRPLPSQPREASATPSPTADSQADSRADLRDARRLASGALRGTGLSIPAGWDVVDVRRERHDDRQVTVIRHQPGGYVLGGPHTSLVLDEDGTLLGYTRLTGQGGAAALPGAAASERTALEFLGQVAPGYVGGLRVEWVDRHDETVTRPDGSTVTVSGMKVKMHHDNGLYAWVIVGADRSILTYERDIAWDSGRGRRGTQMWLHDSWIAAHDNTGPQPDPPYAPATS
ncbi:hypothetical protein [Nonomuraea sp. SBT364]|uniref:hypothetical protein n=1 Tax=Nonomuraea sp. SBT364 TaxID=1580530 RepID=UPI00066AE2D8|nr:hypothetical protein [Nonomuraea sp. SBT364]